MNEWNWDVQSRWSLGSLILKMWPFLDFQIDQMMHAQKVAIYWLHIRSEKNYHVGENDQWDENCVNLFKLLLAPVVGIIT